MADPAILEISWTSSYSRQWCTSIHHFLPEEWKNRVLHDSFLAGRLGLTLRKLLNGDASEVPHYESCSFLALSVCLWLPHYECSYNECSPRKLLNNLIPKSCFIDINILFPTDIHTRTCTHTHTHTHTHRYISLKKISDARSKIHFAHIFCNFGDCLFQSGCGHFQAPPDGWVLAVFSTFSWL